MKNKIFILIAIVSSLFLIDNVRAETTEPVSSKYFDIYSSEMLSRIETDYFNTALSDFDNRFNEIYSEYKKDYPYYMVIAQCHYSNNCYFQTYIFDSIPKFKWKTYYGNSKLYQILWNDESGVGNFNYKTTQQSLYINQSTTNINTLNFGSNVYNQSNVSWSSLVYNFSYNLENNRFYSSYGDFIYDCNFDILKEDDHALKSSRENVDIKINDTYYQADDVIPNYKEYKNPKPKTPYVDLSMSYTKYNENNVPIQAKITVDWGIKDLNNYSYEWTDINNLDDFKIFFSDEKQDDILVNVNGTYIFRVMDLDGNIVSSATFNLTGLNEELPTIKTDIEQPFNCLIDNQSICKNVAIYSENADYRKYTLQYKFSDSDEWITHNYRNSGQGSIGIYKNSIIFARIISNIDNEVVATTTVNISSINEDYISDTPQIKFENYFCTQNQATNHQAEGTVMLKLLFYDSSKYKTYYSTDDANTFTQINDNELTKERLDIDKIRYKYFKFYEETNLIVKITDMQDNYVTSTSFKFTLSCAIDYDPDLGIYDSELKNTNDIFKNVTIFFNKMKKIMSKFTELIEYLFSGFNSEIKAFLVSTFIIIIVCNLIMRIMK